MISLEVIAKCKKTYFVRTRTS